MRTPLFLMAATALGCATTPRPAPPRPETACLEAPSVATAASIRRDIFTRAFRDISGKQRCCANTFLAPRERREGRVVVKVTWEEGELEAVKVARADAPLGQNPRFLQCVEAVTRTLEVPELRPSEAFETREETGAPGEVPVPKVTRGLLRPGNVTISYPLLFTFERA